MTHLPSGQPRQARQWCAINLRASSTSAFIGTALGGIISCHNKPTPLRSHQSAPYGSRFVACRYRSTENQVSKIVSAAPITGNATGANIAAAFIRNRKSSPHLNQSIGG